jgi:diacylglycerol kinase family enzyme
LERGGHGVRAVPTEGPGTAGGIARGEIAAGADLILVAGGDGTVNEALPGMVGTGVPLAVLPAGTANVLSTELGFSNSMRRAAERLGHLIPRRIALGVLHAAGAPGPRYFLLMAGAGVDAAIVHRLDTGFKKRFGKLAYFLGGVRQMARPFEEFEVRYADKSHRVSFALASRVRKYGGDFDIARRVTLLDDHFETVLLEGRGIFRYVPYLAGMLARRLEGRRGAIFADVSGLDLSVEPGVEVHVQVDGEYGGRLPARVELAPAALSLLVPPEYGER